MSIHIALLRGINVGGHKAVAMAELVGLLTDLGFAGGRALLQSGNLIFDSGRKKGPALEHLLEVETTARLAIEVDYLVRSAQEWSELVERNPFPDEARRDPGHLLVMFLKAAPSSKSVQALEAEIKGPEIVRADGKQLYIVYPEGIGRSKLTNALIERTLAVRGTGRNWNTVMKLAALCE